jgi:AraC-like DNA-binding protein
LHHGPTPFEATFGGDGTVTAIVNLSEAQCVERIVRGRSCDRFAGRGTATLIGPDVEQRFVVTGEADVLLLTLTLDELEAYGFDGAVRELFNEPHFELERLAYRAVLALEEQDEDFWMADLGSKLAAILNPELPNATSLRGGLSPTACRRLFSFIEAYLDRPQATSPSLKMMAAEVDLSVYHFTREFVRTVGVTPYKYTLRKRLERARDHMLRQDDDIEAISKRYGFASASHFVYRFHREMGVAPARLRMLIGKRAAENRGLASV